MDSPPSFVTSPYQMRGGQGAEEFLTNLSFQVFCLTEGKVSKNHPLVCSSNTCCQCEEHPPDSRVCDLMRSSTVAIFAFLPALPSSSSHNTFLCHFVSTVHNIRHWHHWLDFYQNHSKSTSQLRLLPLCDFHHPHNLYLKQGH